MKHIIASAIAMAAIAILAGGDAQAQTNLHSGSPYPPLLGGFNSQGLGFSFQRPREQPPFFAQFPPVYYSHAVKRPYGVSPFAAPAGVVPVELTHPLPAVNPLVIENPHVKHGAGKNSVAPVIEKQISAPKNNDKIVKWQLNPFVNTNQEVIAAEVLLSLDTPEK